MEWEKDDEEGLDEGREERLFNGRDGFVTVCAWSLISRWIMGTSTKIKRGFYGFRNLLFVFYCLDGSFLWRFFIFFGFIFSVAMVV